jgi:hypothetical protein
MRDRLGAFLDTVTMRFVQFLIRVSRIHIG